MNVDDLLLSDNENDEGSSQEKPFKKKGKDSILGPSYGPINIDNIKINKDSENILMASNIMLNKEQNKEKNILKENNPIKDNGILSFLYNNEPTQLNKNNQTNINKQYIQTPPSNNSNQSLDKTSKQFKATNKVSLQSSSLLQSPPYIQPQIDEIFDERKEYEDKIKEYKTQKELIRKAYPIDIERKLKEYEIAEKNYKEEIEKLENRLNKELKDEENYYNEKINKYNQQISEIEEEKMIKINNLRESLEKIYQQDIEQLENNYKINKENIELNHKLELDQINMELEKIKENENNILSDKISNIKLDDLYDEIYTKINSKNNDIELNIQLKKMELLKKDLDAECTELSEQSKKIKESVELYNKRILEKKLELNDMIDMIEKEKKELKNKEYELKNDELKMKIYYEKNINDLDEKEKNLEYKFDEENNLNILNEELTKEENKLNEEKKLFEEEKKNIIKNIEDKKKELKNKTDDIIKLELESENKLNELKKFEIKIINSLNEIKNNDDYIIFEKENIQKEKLNIEIAGKRIQNNIQLLNLQNEDLIKEEERIKKIKIDIEQEYKRLNDEYKKVEQENISNDLKSQTVDNMRMNYILNNKYEKNINNDLNEIGFKTMPNFGNNYNNNFGNNYNNKVNNFNNTRDIKPKTNFAQTFSIFNQGGRKLNADEYFEKLNKEMQDKKRLEGIDNIDTYIINGNNFLKDKRKELKQLENK